MIMAIDYKEKYFNSIDKSLQQLVKDVRKNTEITSQVQAQVEKTNGRVTRLEAWRNSMSRPVSEKDLPSPLKDPKLIAIAFNVSLAILILIATLSGVNISGVL